jgi:hypothetical protein
MAKWKPAADDEIARQNEVAVRRAREADRIEPRARLVSYDEDRGLIMVELRSGFLFGFPPERVGLAAAGADDLRDVRVSPSGDGLRWDHLDAAVSLTGIMGDALNLREWAPRFMGQITSEAKARAARQNGMKGGRPRRTRKSAETP